MHDQICSAVPFEMMRIGDQFPALRQGIRRGLLLEKVPYHAPPVPRAVYNVLLIVNPTCDLSGAEVEGLKVMEILKKEFGHEHSLPRMNFTMLRRHEATLSNILGEVSLGTYDFIHYAGHGDFVLGDPEKSGLRLHDGILTAERLQSTLSGLNNSEIEDARPPTLIILNACLAGRVSMRERDGFGVSLARAVLQSGVGGFIGNRWTVQDGAAKVFALRIITDLIGGVPLGKAIINGRLTLFEKEQRDWCNYVFYGSPEIRL